MKDVHLEITFGKTQRQRRPVYRCKALVSLNNPQTSQSTILIGTTFHWRKIAPLKTIQSEVCDYPEQLCVRKDAAGGEIFRRSIISKPRRMKIKNIYLAPGRTENKLGPDLWPPFFWFLITLGEHNEELKVLSFFSFPSPVVSKYYSVYAMYHCPAQERVSISEKES